MINQREVKLTSSEMASLWDTYLNQTHIHCVLQYFNQQVEDVETKNLIVTFNNQLTEAIQETKNLLEQEEVPVPKGFSVKEDVHLNAERLFSDSFYLIYIKNVSRIMVSACGLMFTMSSRNDIRQYFLKCLNEATNMFNQVSDLLLEKGIYVRPPFIDPPKQGDTIESKDYLSGNNLFSDQRNLNVIEISHLYANLEANGVGNSIVKGFSQTADLKEVREYMADAGKLTEKVLNTLTSFLTGSDLPISMPSDIKPYSSSIPPFSDRLMMYEVSILTAAGLADYASSLAGSLRNDLITHYSGLLSDTSKLAKKGENIMIKNQWAEQPPQPKKVIK